MKFVFRQNLGFVLGHVIYMKSQEAVVGTVPGSAKILGPSFTDREGRKCMGKDSSLPITAQDGTNYTTESSSIVCFCREGPAAEQIASRFNEILKHNNYKKVA